MKNRILVFLVFITTILKGQSVDPETFPTVIGEIGNKNLYTNTGGEGKVSIKTIMDSVTSLSIPLNGTRVGEPVSGTLEFEDNFIGLSFAYGNSGLFTDANADLNVYGANSLVNFKDNEVLLDVGVTATHRGYTGSKDFTPNITDLDYTQKIYVDTKASKLGADDIEITDFNKGVILTSPNGSRYRITVDNSGILSTTIIP